MSEVTSRYRVIDPVQGEPSRPLFRAHDSLLDRPVTLYVASTTAGRSAEIRDELLRQVRALARLRHPSVPVVYDVAEDDGRLIVVMEPLEGATLSVRLRDAQALTLREKLDVIGRVCEGLDHAHRHGVVHGALAPDAIVVLHDGVKFPDIGLSAFAGASAAVPAHARRYRSPEHADGHVDHRSDIFSVGAILYELLAARPAFAGDDAETIAEQVRATTPPALRDVVPDIPPHLDAAVARALRKDPFERFADLGQMRAEISRPDVVAAGTTALALRALPAIRRASRGVQVAAHLARARPRLVAIGSGTFAAIVASALFLRPSPPSPRPAAPVTATIAIEKPAGPPVVESLQQSVTAARDKAARAGADRLAQKRFAEASAHEQTAAKELAARDDTAAKRELRETLRGYQSPLVEARRPRETADVPLPGKSRSSGRTTAPAEPLTTDQKKAVDDAVTLAQVFEARGDLELARREYRRALALAPDHGEAKKGLGRMDESLKIKLRDQARQSP